MGERLTPDAPHRHRQPAQRAGTRGWESVRPRTPHTGPGSPPRGRALGGGRASDPGRPTPAPAARPEVGQSRVGEHPTPDAPDRPRQPAQRAGSWGRESARPRTPQGTPPGDALPPPPQLQAKLRGTGTGPPPPKHARRSKGPGQDTRRGTDHVERPYKRPVPEPRGVRTPHHPGGGGADAAGARAHKHERGTRGQPEGQPDRARGTHRPRGMAYQRARVRDTRTGRPATRSAEHAGREGGKERDTTPGTGPNPTNRPRAPHTHRRGTAPAKAVVAHGATPQPLG